MGIFKTLADQARSIKENRIGWKAELSKIKHIKDKKENAFIIKEPIPKEEYVKRYNNLRLTAGMTLTAALLCLCMMPFSESLARFIFTSLGFIWFGLFYFRHSYQLWVARQGWASWRTITTIRAQPASEFIKHALENPAELLPIGIGQKQL